MWGSQQGCQILYGTKYQNGKNIPNYVPKHICTKLPQNIANVNKIDQMAVK
jgi:hypothetical protein